MQNDLPGHTREQTQIAMCPFLNGSLSIHLNGKARMIEGRHKQIYLKQYEQIWTNK